MVRQKVKRKKPSLFWKYWTRNNVRVFVCLGLNHKRKKMRRNKRRDKKIRKREKS